ncbi:MAG TPA: muconate cycloisomerase [Gammaproteobacteria bacterium]|nr:muconate cycloisomerase [Gammaproteobacteria bacterium]
MTITNVKATPLLVRNKVPYYWAAGVRYGAEVILIEVQTDDGITGYGESIGTPSVAGVSAFVNTAALHLIGGSVFDSRRLMRQCYHALFQAHGTCSAPRFGGQVFAGLEMAMWDAAGKTAGCAVHELLGGKVRDSIDYFGFIQGETAEMLAADAARLVSEGHRVIYGKVGRGEQLDIEIVRQVRAAVGESVRLRFDPNEAWDPLTATKMICKLAVYDVEMIEQPCDHRSLYALRQIRESSSTAIAADQSVFNAADVYTAVTLGAADLIVLGLHETGGIVPFLEAASVAAAAGINICIHGVAETGITTCAANHAAALIPNLDDGNQYMNHLLASDIISSPRLELTDASLPVLSGPGFGFEINPDAVAKAAEDHRSGSVSPVG